MMKLLNDWEPASSPMNFAREKPAMKVANRDHVTVGYSASHLMMVTGDGQNCHH